MPTPAEIQAQFDKTGMEAQIVRSIHIDDDFDAHYVVGLVGFGRTRWCQTTIAGNAAAQAAEIRTALRA